MAAQTNTNSNSHELHPPVSYIIGGVPVDFPTKAYPSQIAMMSKVIQSLKTRQNSLLESPTGSGKSLALLCASLAWQNHEAARVTKHNAEIDERERQRANEKPLKGQKTKNKDVNIPKTGNDEVQGSSSMAKFEFLLSDDEDDFQPPKRTKTSNTTTTSSGDKGDFVHQGSKPSDCDKSCTTTTSESSNSEQFSCPLADKKLQVPKIFFGTRTHKQIAQITRELRKTVYKSARSVVLASRDYTCVNPVVSKQPNKNEACKELLDTATIEGGGCGWHMSAKKFGTFPNLSNLGLSLGYDLEEFVQLGREYKACPYYATRQLMPVCDIIFCPYNYLIDPHIRKSMAIELSGQIVIFDEAHNMEDISRDASSSSISQESIQSAMQDCEKVAQLWSGGEADGHQELAELLSKLSLWMDSASREMRELDFSNEGRHWTGTEFSATMKNFGFSDNLPECKNHFREIMAHRDMHLELMKERGRVKPKELHKQPLISALTVKLIEDVFHVFDQLERENGLYRDDFRVALLKSTIRRRKNVSEPTLSRSALSLNFWCLNPAVAFVDLKEQVHCIVLTSGTLSPLQSFKSELGTAFPIVLEASHVIDQNQIYAGAISCGPSNKNLNGSYQSVETFAYQDELGDLVARVCQLIPHGVLCFFPSYRLLEKVTERWQMTSCWSIIEGLKDIYIEPRSGNAEFQDIISSFYASIEETNVEPRGSITGALFMAVCRGKVSEGLDFADNNARAVICIGIPFPNFKDLQIGLKRDYNEKNRSRGLLPGAEWYEIQAFRALNQALGRCIRHRHDWGAILLVDDRFQRTPRYINSLSKWVRNSVRPFHSWQETETGLVHFRDKMLLAYPRPVTTSKEIDIDLPADNAQHPGVLLGNNPSTSSESGLLPAISDRFSSSWGIPSPIPGRELGVGNNSRSPYFGSKSTPQRVFSIFAPAAKKPKTSNKGSKMNPITFDDED